MNYAQTIEISASTYENGGLFPDKIVVQKGVPVKLVVYGADMVHSVAIPGVGVDTGSIKPGHTVVVEFTPDKSGIFLMYCRIPCSPLHSSMTGELVAV